MRNDRLGPASCFAFQHGYDTNAVLGACLVRTTGDVDASLAAPTADERTADASSGGDAAGDALSAGASASEAGPCMLVEPECRSSPPLDGASSAVAPEDAAAEDGALDAELTDAEPTDASDGAADAELDGGGS